MREPLTVKQTGLRYGLMIAAVLVVYSLILEVGGLSANKLLGYITFLILISGIVWAHREFKVKGDGFLSYGQALTIGTIISAIGGFLNAFFSYLYLKMVDDSSLEMILEEMRAEWEKEGIDDEVIDQFMGMFEPLMTPGWTSLMYFVGFLIVGFLISLVISAFTKKHNPELEI